MNNANNNNAIHYLDHATNAEDQECCPVCGSSVRDARELGLGYWARQRVAKGLPCDRECQRLARYTADATDEMVGVS